MSNLNEIPDPGSISSAATGLGTMCDGLTDAVGEITTAWSVLSSCYHSPEEQVVYTALQKMGEPVTELIALAGKAKIALQDYADVLVALHARRELLLQRINTLENLPSSAPTGDTGFAELQIDISHFNSATEAADGDCAAALRALHRYWSWGAGEALEIPNSLPASVVQGLAAELMDRYRTIVSPAPGAPPIEIPLTSALLEKSTMIKGARYVMRNGLWVPAASALPRPPATMATPPGWRTTGTLTVNPKLGGPPTWARWGGKALAIVGGALTYWSVYVDRYNDTLVKHPEWTESQRASSAWLYTGIKGTTSVAGGIAGGYVGASLGTVIGAALGSEVPGPGNVVGGIVGGIAGGVGGGILGSDAGAAVGDAILNGLDP